MARFSMEVYATSIFRPSSLMRVPAFFASPTPFSDKFTSTHPVNLFATFHSDSPCREKTSFANTPPVSLAFMYAHKSTKRFEYPHSLSYQLTSFTKVSVSAMPALTLKMDEDLQLTKSVDTTSSSVQSRTPA